MTCFPFPVAKGATYRHPFNLPLKTLCNVKRLKAVKGGEQVKTYYALKIKGFSGFIVFREMRILWPYGLPLTKQPNCFSIEGVLAHGEKSRDPQIDTLPHFPPTHSLVHRCLRCHLLGQNHRTA
jgi:hypothetical protein